MSIGSSADDYQQQLVNLTPPGNAFPTDPSSTWVAFLSVLAQTFARIDENITLLVDESFPDTTLQLLPNWERVAGLPDACSVLGDTIEIRRQNLLAKLTARGGQTKQYLIDVALSLGFIITITEFSAFEVDKSAVEDALCDETWRFVFEVNAPSETVTWFRSGNSSAGEALAVWGNARLECLINRLKPAHTIALFAYG